MKVGRLSPTSVFFSLIDTFDPAESVFFVGGIDPLMRRFRDLPLKEYINSFVIRDVCVTVEISVEVLFVPPLCEKLSRLSSQGTFT